MVRIRKINQTIKPNKKSKSIQERLLSKKFETTRVFLHPQGWRGESFSTSVGESMQADFGRSRVQTKEITTARGSRRIDIEILNIAIVPLTDGTLKL